MKKVNSKSITYQNLLINCVNNIRDKTLENSVYSNIHNFKLRSDKYKELAENKELYKVTKDLSDGFTKDNMDFLYTKLRSSTNGRTYYEKITSISPVCPYCGVQMSSSLDHYLPKKKFPMYAVDPHNLVPSCFDCNNLKGEHEQKRGTETIHPYFDFIGEERFLKTEVVFQDNNVAFNFYLDVPSDTQLADFEKIINHFYLLKLDRLYAVLSSSEVHSQIYNFKKLIKKGNVKALQENLEDIYYSNLDADANSWKTALYDGLRNSDWFCNEGVWLFKYVIVEDEVESPIPIPVIDGL